jgi:hypothetical protein
MSYTLRSTSLVGNHLDTELTKRGAHTSGTTARKQVRLQRFRDAEDRIQESRDTLRVVIENEQHKVYTRSQARAAEIRHSYNTRSKKGIIALIQSYLY